jgi:hypothetical protein
MSNLSELGEVGQGNASAVKVFGAAIGTVADFAGAVGAVASILGAVISAVQGGQTDLADLKNTILAVGAALNAHQKAQDINLRWTNLDNQIAPAQGVLDGLQADLNNNISQADKNSRIEICATTMEALKDAVWFAPYQDQLYWNDYPDFLVAGFPTSTNFGYCESPDKPVSPGPDPSGNVFSYTYVMPSYLRALAIFMTVGEALDANFVQDFGETVLAPAADLLQQWHEKIVNDGITQISPAPFPAEPRAYPWDPLPAPQPWTGSTLYNANVGTPSWKGITHPQANAFQSNVEYGAVERFSGVSATGTYVIQLTLQFAGADQLQVFSNDPTPHKKFQLRVLKKSKDVYVGAGLVQVRTTVDKLRSIMGVAPSSGPTFADWSFRQIGAVLGFTSLKEMKALIESTPPIDTPAQGGAVGVGFRALLNASA